jgi:hypothetical protein
MKKLVGHASENNDIKRRVIAEDGAYDRKKNFRYLHVNDIEAVIKVKKNSFGKAMGCCYPRKIIAVLQQLSDFRRWRRSVGYGHRWMMVETLFSAMKRMLFGEYVMARN